MSKNIKDYAIKQNPIDEDFVLGTDAQFGTNDTKNFLLVDIAALGPFRFDGQHSLVYNKDNFVGINTDTADDRLHVNNGAVLVTNNSNSTSILFNGKTGSSFQQSIQILSSVNDDSVWIRHGESKDGIFIENTNRSTTFKNETTNISVLTVKNNRFVSTGSSSINVLGVNAPDPERSVDIIGNFRVVQTDYTFTANPGIQVQNIRGDLLTIYASTDSVFNIASAQGISIALNPNTNGNVAIGKPVPDTLYKLDVNGWVRADEFWIDSDEQLKENIEPLESAFDKVLQLAQLTKSYTLKKSKRDSIGLIAQDVEQIIPTAVQGDDIKSVNYREINMYLLKAFAELCEKLNIQ